VSDETNQDRSTPEDAASTGQSASGYHRLEDLIICPRKFAYRAVMNLVPAVAPEALALGTAVHEGLQAHYDGRGWEAGLENPGTRWAYKVGEARGMLRAYAAKWINERFEVLDLEREFRVSCRSGIDGQRRLFTRRIDMIVLEQDGKVWIYDHKTAANPYSRARSVGYDASLFTQNFIGRYMFKSIYGVPYGGMRLNLLGKSAPYKFYRPAMDWLPQIKKDAPREIGDWLLEAERVVEQIEAPGGSPWKVRKGWQCQGRYSFCDYWDLCAHGPSALSLFEREIR